MKKLYSILLVFHTLAAIVLAESPMFEGSPLVAEPPATGKWMMQFLPSESDGAATQSNMVKLVEIRKNAGKGVTRVTFSDKSVKVFYYVADAIIHPVDVAPGFQAVELKQPASELDSATGFFGVDWVRPEYLVEKAVENGRPVLHFRNTVQSTEKEGVVSRELPLEAWIDAETRLPSAVRTSHGIVRYQFSPPPYDQVELPSAALEALRRLQSQQFALKAMEMR